MPNSKKIYKINLLGTIMSKQEKISAFIIVYHEADLIERALKSVKGIVDEILVFHDGPCLDDTLKVAKKYTPKVFVLPRKTRAALHLITAIKKARNDWVLKLDADEYLSDRLRKNINKLAQNKEASAYTFIWPWWDGKKYITKDWPAKKAMFRKSRASFIQYPGWDEPNTEGKTIDTNYLLEHRPKKKNSFSSPKSFIEKALGKYCKGQARCNLQPLSDFETYNYHSDDFPFNIRLRRRFPLLSAPLFSIAAFFIILKKHHFLKEGKPVLLEAFKTAVFYLFLGYYIFSLKIGRDLDNIFPMAKPNNNLK